MERKNLLKDLIVLWISVTAQTLILIKKNGDRMVTVLMVRIKGFEPSRYRYHTDLNRARLPIPPYPHIGTSLTCDFFIIHHFR